MKATSPSSSYSFGYAALDWCCDDGRGTASLDDKQESDKKGKSKFFRRRAAVDSNSSASTASTQDDLSTEPLMTPVDPITIWEPHSFGEAAEVPNVREVTRDIPPPPVERSESELAERAMGPIDLDDLEEVAAPSNSQEDSTLVSLNTNAIPSLGSLDSTPEKPEELPATAVVETEPLAAVPESPTDLLESSHVVEDPLLLLLVSQGPERSEKRDPGQLDALLQNILQDDEVTLASSAASTAAVPPPSGDLMDALAAGPVDVDDFIPEDSYWSMNTQDFILDEVDVSRQLAGYHEGCEPPCIDHVDLPSSPPRSMTRQRTAATAETTELWRRAHAMRRPDVVRRHVTAPTTRPTHSVRPTATHPGSVGRPSVRHTATRYTGASVRPSGASVRTNGGSVRPNGGSVRPNGGSVRPTGASVATRPSTQNSGAVRRPPHHVMPMPPSPQRVAPHSPSHSPPSVLRKERRWLPESAAEV